MPVGGKEVCTMTQLQQGPGTDGRITPMECLTAGRRRRAVRALAEHADSLPVQKLAARMVAEERRVTTGDVSEQSIRQQRLCLHHVDLPKLAAAGLVRWEKTDETVATTDHPLFTDPGFQQLLGTTDDAVVEAMARDASRHALVVLRSTAEPVSRDYLARKLAAHETGDEPPAETRERLSIRLHHAILPKLDEGGLVDWDPSTEQVTYCGPTDLPGLVPMADEAEDTAERDNEIPPKIP